MRARFRGLRAIVFREALRFFQQRERFVAALLRPLLWLFVFGAGFRGLVEVAAAAPYERAVSYELYLAPGLCAMILLFSGMQSSLSMVHDRETGAMRLLLVSPFPRWFLLCAKLAAATLVSLAQVYVFLGVAAAAGIRPPPAGYVAAAPALLLSGVMLASLGLLLSSAIRQLENFAGVMNFVIFPLFFASSALYPLSRMREGSPVLAEIAGWSPFTHAVELIRHALHLQLKLESLAVVCVAAALFLVAAIMAFDPESRLQRRRR